MFEAVEAAFDEVSLFIQSAIIAARLFPVPPWRDDSDRTQAFDSSDDLGRVVSLVCDDSFGPLALQQADRLSIFGSLPGRDTEGYWQPGFVG